MAHVERPGAVVHDDDVQSTERFQIGPQLASSLRAVEIAYQ